jgi:hypothetical protein
MSKVTAKSDNIKIIRKARLKLSARIINAATEVEVEKFQLESTSSPLSDISSPVVKRIPIRVKAARLTSPGIPKKRIQE